nr:hypothetical protein GTC16762_08040 [Pigmentibacter ruber]
MIGFNKIKNYFRNINILWCNSTSYNCIIYGCDSKYKKNVIDIVSSVSNFIFIEIGTYYILFYRFLFIIPFFIKIILNRKDEKNLSFIFLAVRASLLYQTIHTYKPKIVLTYIDNDPVFQLIADFCSSIKFITIQNGARGMYNIGNISHLKIINYFCFSKYDMNFLLRNGYKANRWIPVGNFLTSIFVENVVKKNNFSKEFDICLVSQWRNEFYEDYKNNKEFHSLRISIDSVINTLDKFIKKYPKTKMCITLFSNDEREYNLYKNVFDERCTIFKTNKFNIWTSYEAIIKSRTTVSINSTMLIEALELKSLPLGYNPSGDPYNDATLPDIFLSRSEEELIGKLIYNLSKVEEEINEISERIPACEIVKNAINFAIEGSPQLFEDYLDKFSVRIN